MKGPNRRNSNNPNELRSTVISRAGVAGSVIKPAAGPLMFRFGVFRVFRKTVGRELIATIKEESHPRVVTSIVGARHTLLTLCGA
jgi:hypothetical protein